MTSPVFIRTFKRLSSLHESRNVTLCDNFKIFKSAEVKRFLLDNNDKKKRVLSASPWQGGFYKYLVRSVKFPLCKILDTQEQFFYPKTDYWIIRTFERTASTEHLL